MTYSRLIGALFLVGFLFYGVGATLVTSVTGGPDFLSTLSAHQTTLVMRRSEWLLGGMALASLLEACTVAPAPPPASTPIATKLVLLDAANIDTPKAAPHKQVLTDFMARNPEVAMDVRALPSGLGRPAAI